MGGRVLMRSRLEPVIGGEWLARLAGAGRSGSAGTGEMPLPG